MIDDIAFGNLDVGIMYAPRFLPEIGFDHIMTQRFLLVSSTAKRCSAIELKSYIRAGYTPALEKSHSELLPELSRPRLSVGLDTLAIESLRRNGGTAYVPEHAIERLRSEGIANVVQDAPVITQPVFSATHIRRRTSPYVKKALAGLRQLIATGRYGSDVSG
jgi:hypothetical protein